MTEIEFEEGIKEGLLIVISSDKFGDGGEELGLNLMKNFIYSQREADLKPEAMIFINNGIKLTIKESPVLDHLQALIEDGVEIWTCGACLDYYDNQDDLAVGEVTNMYSVVEMINAAKSVVNL